MGNLLNFSWEWGNGIPSFGEMTSEIGKMESFWCADRILFSTLTAESKLPPFACLHSKIIHNYPRSYGQLYRILIIIQDKALTIIRFNSFLFISMTHNPSLCWFSMRILARLVCELESWQIAVFITPPNSKSFQFRLFPHGVVNSKEIVKHKVSVKRHVHSNIFCPDKPTLLVHNFLLVMVELVALFF